MSVRKAIQRAVEISGGTASGLAAAMSAVGEGVLRQHVEYWLKSGRVPAARCCQIEVAVNGVVRRWDLRPHDWHCVWPELVGREGAPDVPAPAAEKVA